MEKLVKLNPNKLRFPKPSKFAQFSINGKTIKLRNCYEIEISERFADKLLEESQVFPLGFLTVILVKWFS